MDDEFLSPGSSFPVSPPAVEFENHHHQCIEFTSSEQWLLGDAVVPAKSEDTGYLWPPGSLLSPNSELSELPAASLPASTEPAARPGAKRRGRKPGPRPGAGGPTVSHVEAERKRRGKLNRSFCDLRAAVPTVSQMDKASLLADATAYIAELRARVSRLEDESKQSAAARLDASSASGGGGDSFQNFLAGDETVEVRMVGRDAAAMRVTTAAGSAPHAPARLMSALRSLELHVQHACMSRVQGATVQDVVVDVPAALQQDDGAALHSALLQSGCATAPSYRA